MLGLDGRIWRSPEQADGSFPDFGLRSVGSPANVGIRVAAVPMANNGIDVYMVGTDHRMWHAASRADGSFPDFALAPVGSPANLALDIAIVRRRSDKVTAFMVGMDNHLWRSDQAADGTFPDFANKPVASKSNLAQRITAVRRADDSVELFMIGMNGRMWHAHEQADGTFPDFALGPVGSSTNLATNLAAAQGADGRITVYMIGMPVNGRHSLWRSEEQANGAYTDFAEHHVGETELSVRDVSVAPQLDGGGDVYIVNDATQNAMRDYQDARHFGWNELNVPRTGSIDNGWYIYYPWAFAAPNGSVFVASASDRSYWIDPGPQPRLREGPRRNGIRIYGTAVMYEPGKILVLGGSQEAASEATNTTEIIDLNAAVPVWSTAAIMNYPRQHATATLLPDGQVLVTNGTRSGGDPSASWEANGNAVLPSEIWNPATNTWTVVASSPEPRTYHSNALLLSDARVLVSGGGQGGGGIQANGAPGVPDHPNADLFSPPYLFRGARPSITSAPRAIAYGKTFSIASNDAAAVSNVTLLRLGATTHAFNQNQQFMRLLFTRPSLGTLTVTGPANANIAPPGHYLLFLISDTGVPSSGQVVSVSD